VTLADGRLYALCNPYALDGRVTLHPPEARGFAAMNTYVLSEDDDALVIDTGISIHTDAILDQLAALIGPTQRLALLQTRIGEYTTICNSVPIAERFGVALIHAEWEDAARWVDFRPGRGRDRDGELGALGRARVRLFSVPDTIPVDAEGRRSLDIFHSTLRLLPTSWLYDAATRTLFTSDVFTHVVRRDREGPWIATADDDDTPRAWLRRHLLSTRYWWLSGARLHDIRESLAETFASYDIETIAPDFGCILHGRDVVRRHWRMLDDVLAEAQSMPPVPMARGEVPTVT
jgi:hypothetical protein